MTSKRDAIKGESMGFRIRKSISLGKGMRVNLGKNGISSVTFGKRGAPHVTVGKRGTYVGASVPGTGISYSQKISDEKPAKAKKAKKNTKRSKADAAQLPLTTSPVETIVMPYPSDADKLTLTNTPSVSTNELSNSNGPTDPPTGGKHTKKSKQPGSWKRWIVIILVAVVALAIGNMSADPTQSSQYKQLEQQLTSQKQHNNKLQRQVDELNRKLDDIQDLKDQLEQQKAEQDSQQKQLDQQQSEQEQDQKQQEQDQRQTQLDEREKNIAQREEAKKQAQEQQLAQVAQQQSQAAQSPAQAPAATSLGRAHGGAFCSSAGATAQSDRSSSILTCRTASDDRLRWMR